MDHSTRGRDRRVTDGRRGNEGTGQGPDELRGKWRSEGHLSFVGRAEGLEKVVRIGGVVVLRQDQVVLEVLAEVEAERVLAEDDGSREEKLEQFHGLCSWALNELREKRTNE